jgi:hypothetical protein|tara:strand:+ start:450 stop:731 length:282 start_codon:yes stop_codon:yes gene_type:complete
MPTPPNDEEVPKPNPDAGAAGAFAAAAGASSFSTAAAGAAGSAFFGAGALVPNAKDMLGAAAGAADPDAALAEGAAPPKLNAAKAVSTRRRGS